ncbi:hypothetical protein A3F66_00020 [candidate division TM6 bacterium RIFCSPHIGHO2_12_FULL_32_22]|nr:MAG: hypothetical protein A3F66_00020 [candidate division TM6 bacterium RIFCSPHIGHO2_12_FULL_32_22]
MFINVYKGTEKIDDLKSEELKSFLNKSYNALILVDNKDEFFKLLTEFAIQDSVSSINSDDTLTIVDSLIVLIFNFFYFKKEKEIHCQVKIILSKNYLIIFSKDKFFLSLCQEVIKNRKTEELGHILHLLFNHILGYYLSIIENWTDEVALIESNILQEVVERDSYLKLSNMRSDIIHLNRAIKRQAEHLKELVLMEHEYLTKSSKFYFEITYEKASELSKTLDKLNDIILNIYSLYLATLTVQQNETMKVLTSIAAIFLPISFLASFFGMNFQMPFLKYEYGYLLCAAVMVVITLGSVLYFKRKRWI